MSMVQVKENGHLEFRIKGGGYLELREFPNSPPSPQLQHWYESAKIAMNLPYASLHFITNDIAKKTVDEYLINVGAIGHAYAEDQSIAFIESDYGIEWDVATMIHELVHLLGFTHANTPYNIFETITDEYISKTKEVYKGEKDER